MTHQPHRPKPMTRLRRGAAVRAIVPEWVIDAPVSDGVFRPYSPVSLREQHRLPDAVPGQPWPAACAGYYGLPGVKRETPHDAHC